MKVKLQAGAMREPTVSSKVLVLCFIFLAVRGTAFVRPKRPKKILHPNNMTAELDKLLQGYDKRLRPAFGGPPTVIDVNLNVRSMGPISELDMAYQMDCYFRQSWVDERLSFPGYKKTLVVSIKVLDRIWKPDTHFFNGKKSYIHTVTTPNKFLRISKDGRILYSMRVTIKATCPMRLGKFPMDTQTCPLKFGSHGYSVSDVLYLWSHGPGHSIKMASDMRLSQFDLIGFPAGNQTFHGLGGAEHSVLFTNFKLRRHMGYFLINVYVPCSLLVVISWVGFWINREATSDRIALGVTTVLTMAFLGIENRRDLPRVSYSTALDSFVGVCFAFVLASIVEFASVHYCTKYGTGDIGIKQYNDDETDDDFQESGESESILNRRGSGIYRNKLYTNEVTNGTKLLTYTRSSTPPASPCESAGRRLYRCLMSVGGHYGAPHVDGVNSVSKIDQVARILFPSVFVAFHFFYWFSNMNWESRSKLFT